MLLNPDTLPPVVTQSSDRFPVSESPAGAIAGALVGVMVVVVAAIVVVLLVVRRRRQRKSSHPPDTQNRTVDNPVYAGIVFHTTVHGMWLLHNASSNMILQALILPLHNSTKLLV